MPSDSAAGSKLYIPEELTPLFHTPSYRQLTAPQRLRYNRLQALYFNEQIMFFETALGRRILAALLREPWPQRIAEGLRQFRDEEERHTEMFRRLNRRFAPQLYGAQDHHFIRVPALSRALFAWMVDHPNWFPLFFWLMLVQEERSLFYSRCYLAHAEAIEPRFVKAHRLHLADELGHVSWDEELIDTLWERAHPLLRWGNAKLFAWMFDEFFSTPKRGQLCVIEELGRDFPELGDLLPEMRRQLLALATDEAYRSTLYSREIVPKTFARFDGSPELRALDLCGYRPLPEGAR
jgi:hypothetical protein